MTNSVWWKFEVIYQIYPRSFRDTNDDGIGDERKNYSLNRSENSTIVLR